MNDDEFLGGFFIGLTVTLVACSLISMYMDSNWGHVESKYLNSISLCKQLGSVPESVDDYTVTCENGKEINWRD